MLIFLSYSKISNLAPKKKNRPLRRSSSWLSSQRDVIPLGASLIQASRGLDFDEYVTNHQYVFQYFDNIFQ